MAACPQGEGPHAHILVQGFCTADEGEDAPQVPSCATATPVAWARQLLA